MQTPSFRWLITGGAGFIGSCLANTLLQQNQHVTVVDDFSSGLRSNLPPRHPGLRILEGSILNLPFLKEAVQQTDFILHHAALVSVPLSIEKPYDTYSINVQGTANVLEAAKQRSVKRVVFASTCAVYGAGQGKPLAETEPLHPNTPYALSKMQGEDLCRSYRSLYGVDFVILRYFNVYGPAQNPKGPYSAVVAKFLDCAAHRQPFPVDGDGLQTRDFVFVQDIARANMWAALQAPAGETYNVATGQSATLLELARTIHSITGTPLDFTKRPARAGDIRISEANVSKLNQAGFYTNTDLTTGLRQCWDYLTQKELL